MRKWLFAPILGACVLIACGGSSSGDGGSGGAAGAGTGAVPSGGSGGSSGTPSGGSGGVTTGGTGGATGGTGGATGGTGGVTGGTGGVPSGGSGGVITGGTGGVITGGTGGVPSGGSGGVITGGTGGAPFGGWGGVLIGGSGGTGGTSTGGGGGLGGVGGGPTSASFEIAIKDQVPVAAAASASGGLLLAMRSPTSTLSTDLALLASDGTPEWTGLLKATTSFGIEHAARRPNGAFVLAAWKQGGQDIGILAPISTSGQLEWAKAYGGLGTFRRVSATSDGGYLVQGFDTSGPITLARMNANGDVQWAVSYKPPSNAWIFDVVATSDGGAALIGSVIMNGPLLAAKVDSQGKTVFAESITISPTVGYNGRVAALPGGGFLAAMSGTTTFTMAFSGTGAVVASQKYASGVVPSAVVPNPKGGFWIAGEYGGADGLWWAKCDANGVLSGARVIPETASGYMNQAVAVADKGDGSLLIASSRTDNNTWWTKVDTVSSTGATCASSQGDSPTKSALSTSVAKAGSFSPITVVSAPFPLQLSSKVVSLPLVCGS